MTTTDIDPEIQAIIDHFVEQIEGKEDDLLLLKRQIDGVLAEATKEMKAVEKDLDDRFDANALSEEDYLRLYRDARERITIATKEKLDAVVRGIESVIVQQQQEADTKQQQIEAIKRDLDVSA